MPALTAIRDAACAWLARALPEAGRVESFCGSLDFERLGPRNVQYSGEGSLFVAVGEARNLGEGQVLDMEGSFWVFAVNRNAARATVAASAALLLIQKAACALHGQTFGLAGISPANVRQIAPISSEELDRARFQVWQLYFTCRFALEAE